MEQMESIYMNLNMLRKQHLQQQAASQAYEEPIYDSLEKVRSYN